MVNGIVERDGIIHAIAAVKLRPRGSSRPGLRRSRTRWRLQLAARIRNVLWCKQRHAVDVVARSPCVDEVRDQGQLPTARRRTRALDL